MDADLCISLSVHREPRGHIDVGMVKIGQFLLPTGILEFKEECPHGLRIIEGRAGDRFYVRRRKFRPGLWGFAILIAPAAAGSSRSAPRRLFFGQKVAGRLAFGGVQTMIAILVEPLQKLDLLLHETWTTGAVRTPRAAIRARTVRVERWRPVKFWARLARGGDFGLLSHRAP